MKRKSTRDLVEEAIWMLKALTTEVRLLRKKK
jgi:hypothetical protein